VAPRSSRCRVDRQQQDPKILPVEIDHGSENKKSSGVIKNLGFADLKFSRRLKQAI